MARVVVDIDTALAVAGLLIGTGHHRHHQNRCELASPWLVNMEIDDAIFIVFI